MTEVVVEDAKSIRLVMSGLQYPSDVWMLPRYVKLSTELPSVVKFKRSNPYVDCSSVFGHETWSGGRTD